MEISIRLHHCKVPDGSTLFVPRNIPTFMDVGTRNDGTKIFIVALLEKNKTNFFK